MNSQKSGCGFSSTRGVVLIGGTLLVFATGFFFWRQGKPESKGVQQRQEATEPVENITVHPQKTSQVELRKGPAKTTSSTQGTRHELVGQLSNALATKNSALLQASVEKIRADLDGMVPELKWVLKNGGRDARETAATLLAERGSQEAVAALIEVYQTTDDDTLRRNIEQIILKVRSDESIEQFLTYFEPDAPGGITKLAELVLAQHGTPRVVEEIDRVYDATDQLSTRRAVAVVFRNLHNPGAIPVLKQKVTMREQPREKLEMYADALGSIRTEEALDILRSLVADADPVRRTIGQEALGK